jgi:hypothetical protein
LLCSLARRKGLTKAETRFFLKIKNDWSNGLWWLHTHISVVQLDFDTFRVESEYYFRDVKVRGNRILGCRHTKKEIRNGFFSA